MIKFLARLFDISAKRTNLGTRNFFRPQLEILEERQLMAAGIALVGTDLVITGSQYADIAQVNIVNSQVKANLLYVDDAGTAHTFEPTYNLADVKRIICSLDGGANKFTIYSNVNANQAVLNHVYFYGGDDRDEFRNNTDIASFAYGGKGEDILQGGSNGDYLEGGFDNDTIYGMGGPDTISGSEGDDFLYGGDDRDNIFGGYQGESSVYASGNDTIFGGNGNDYLSGGNGTDWLYGDGGLDTLIGGFGSDFLDGGLDGYQDILHGGTNNPNWVDKSKDSFIKHRAANGTVEQETLMDYKVGEDVVVVGLPPDRPRF